MIIISVDPPAITNLPTITPTPCSLPKNMGNANGDCVIDFADYEIWQKEFIGEINTQNSDFNSDRKISLIDFEIWRKNYFLR